MSNSSNFKGGIRDTAETVKEEARDAVATASDLGSTLRDEAASKVRQGVDAVADQGQKIAENVRDFASRGTDTGARIIDSVTSTVNDFADQISDGPLASYLEDGKAMVKRNPIAFLAGAAVVGYVLGRAAMRSDRD